MADLRECQLCGFITVRCGMMNHMKAKHPEETKSSTDVIEQWSMTVGNAIHWGKTKKELAQLKRVEQKQTEAKSSE